jgi:16S rRNA C1402 N4-methylase RsmH
MFNSNPVSIMHNDFLGATKQLAQLTENGERFDVIFADLGVSSPHLDNSEPGGFLSNKMVHLDMRMDQQQELTAARSCEHVF